MGTAANSLVAFAVPLLAGWVLEFILGTKWGGRLVCSTGNSFLVTTKGRRLVSKYSGAAAAAAGALALALARSSGEQLAPERDGARTAAQVSELLLATGALVKVAADYLKDRRTIEGRPT